MPYAIAAIVILILLGGYLALRLHIAEGSLRSMVRQLRERQAASSTVHLRLEAPNAAVEELFAAVNDLLERREREGVEYRRQEKALRQQIANVSHDLRTPLTSILGYLQLLEGDALSSTERAEYLDIVRGRAKNLQSLITSFYDLSRLDGDEYRLSKEPVDLRLILSRLAAEFYGDFTDRGLDVTVELDEQLPPVQADPAAAMRVFTNLLKNALEHGTRCLSVRLYREGNALVAEFSNDADSLTEEDVVHVFERFFTADKMRTGQSTGLGLAIVKALVERMGYTVQAGLKNGVFTVGVWWTI